MRYICQICGYVYDDSVEKVPFSELPDTWKCPLCGAAKTDFKPDSSDVPEKENIVLKMQKASWQHCVQILHAVVKNSIKTKKPDSLELLLITLQLLFPKFQMHQLISWR